MYPTGTWSGWYHSNELKNAEKYGYKFKILEGYLFEGALIFKDYIDKLNHWHTFLLPYFYIDHGTLLNGNKFDSSVERGQPFQTKIGVGQVIKGWDEGVPQLSLGQKAKLTCTPDYAYGKNGYPPVIPANSTLVFEVQLLKINGKGL